MAHKSWIWQVIKSVHKLEIEYDWGNWKN